MTRKDYELVADHMAAGLCLIADDSAVGQTCARQMVESLANAFAEDNPRFDRGRFMNAVEDRAEKIAAARAERFAYQAADRAEYLAQVQG